MSDTVDACGRFFSLGAQKLRSIVAASGTTRVADVLGVSKASVSRWCHGQTRPGVSYAEAMRARYRIPIVAWVTEPRLSVKRDGALSKGQ